MKTNFSICNSIQGNHNLGFTITPIAQAREGDPSVSFSYNHAAPSYPGDVMPETSKQIQVGGRRRGYPSLRTDGHRHRR